MSPGAVRGAAGRIAAALLLLCAAQGVPAELPAESLDRVETLPVPYPPHWFWAHDMAFGHYTDGRMFLLDADGAHVGAQFKGMVNAAFGPAFVESGQRRELYVAETFYERTGRGKRTDVVTVYDKSTLAPLGEIVLPGAKRVNTLPSRYAVALIDGGKQLLVYNFTPATSVTVIDVGQRKVINEVPLPGCAMVYPAGKNGFSSLCGNGSLISFRIDERGQVTGRHVIEPFFDIDADALFEKPALIGGIAYFPTFAGNVQEINLGTEQARLGKKWSLIAGSDPAEHWRPGGIHLTGADAAGRLYVLMHPEGKEGSHKEPGREIWVFDAKARSLLRRVTLREPGLSIELTRDPDPLLLVVNVSMNVDVYRARDGGFLRTLSDFGQDEPLLLHAVR